MPKTKGGHQFECLNNLYFYYNLMSYKNTFIKKFWKEIWDYDIKVWEKMGYMVNEKTWLLEKIQNTRNYIEEACEYFDFEWMEYGKDGEELLSVEELEQKAKEFLQSKWVL